jgi:hypothetical protein
MADEGTLKMNSERESPMLAVCPFSFALFNRSRESLERSQGCIHGSADGGGKITRDPMPGDQTFDRGQRLDAIVHDVISGAAVNVKIDVTRRYYGVAEVDQGDSGGKLAAAPSGNFDELSLLDEHQRMLDGVRRSQQSSRSKSRHINVLIEAKLRL